MNENKVKAIINDLVGFEKKYIEIIETVETTFGGLKQIIFAVKGEQYEINVSGESFKFDFYVEPCDANAGDVSRETLTPDAPAEA